LDVPLAGDEPGRTYKNGTDVVDINATTPCIVYLRELVETTQTTSAVSVSTNYFDPEERQHIIDGDLQDKFITEFNSQKVFGCRVVVTNVSSVSQRVEILCQIPTGSVACGIQCLETQCYFQELAPFGTYRREFFFYWPEAGVYSHFPPHINKNGKTVGCGGGLKNINVTKTVVNADTTSWRYISNLAEPEKVLEFLKTSPDALNVNLEKICWRLKDPEFFNSVTSILRERQIFNDKVWAYSLISDKGGKALGEYLAWNSDFVTICGPHLKSSLVNIDLYAIREWDIFEFWPLLNPRAHSQGNDYGNFKDYYYEFLRMLAFSTPNVDGISLADKLSLTYYLLIRNKMKLAVTLFKGIDAEAARKELPIAYDYFKVYLDTASNNVDEAVATASKYVGQELPPSIKKKFQDVLDSLAESKNSSLSDAFFLEEEEARKQEAAKPFVSFEVIEGHQILISYRNISQCTVNFYLTDLEVLFSAHPFQESNTGYKLVTPNESIALTLDPNDTQCQVKLPKELKDNNTIIQIETETLEVVDLYNDNELDVQIAEEEGELRVLSKGAGRPVAGAYCKVYSQDPKGKEKFYKDGYTDIRGRFDYLTLSNDSLSEVSKLAILISMEKLGSLVTEVEVNN